MRKPGSAPVIQTWPGRASSASNRPARRRGSRWAATSSRRTHLDPRRRAGLFDALEALPGQVWMTGADPALFGELGLNLGDCFAYACAAVRGLPLLFVGNDFSRTALPPTL
jgi:hypothetical protein